VASDPAHAAVRPRFAVVTASDSSAAGTRPDVSGPLAAEILEAAFGVPPLVVDVVPDDRESLERRLIGLTDGERCDLIVTTGGTGLAPRDVTPEATLAVVDRLVPGIAEAIRAGGMAKTPFAMLSRGVAGQRGTCLIVNLAGSPKAVREQLAILIPVLPHALSIAAGVAEGHPPSPPSAR
jgi:molybdenum cofactor synthesis domain-containing protein